jgi:hypothetical protein
VLDKDTLEQSLLKLFTGNPSYPTTSAAAAQKWADIYGAYAKTAKASTTTPTPPLVDAAVVVLATSLANAFTSAQAAGPGYQPILVSGMVTALTAFWPPVAFAAPGIVGVATSPLPAALTTALNAFLVALDASGARPGAASRAHDLAAVLHTWTGTVMVVNTVGTSPPQPPVPLT